MPHDRVEVVVSLSLLTCHNMVNQSLLISARLNTKHPRGMHSTWFHLELGGRASGKIQGVILCLHSVPSQSHMDLRRHPRALVGSLMHLRYYGSKQIDQGTGRSWGAGILQNGIKLHSYTRDTLLGPDWRRLESDTQLEESTQTYWGIIVSCPLM